jgi:hypothetical protein
MKILLIGSISASVLLLFFGIAALIVGKRGDGDDH